MSQWKGASTLLPHGTVVKKKDATEEDSEDITVANGQMVRTLLYLSNTVRPDISFTVVVLSRDMQDPGTEHMNAAKHVLTYLSKSSAAVGS